MVEGGTPNAQAVALLRWNVCEFVTGKAETCTFRESRFREDLFRRVPEVLLESALARILHEAFYYEIPRNMRAR